MIIYNHLSFLDSSSIITVSMAQAKPNPPPKPKMKKPKVLTTCNMLQSNIVMVPIHIPRRVAPDGVSLFNV